VFSASGGRDPATGRCRAAPKPDFCAAAEVTQELRQLMLKFFRHLE